MLITHRSNTISNNNGSMVVISVFHLSYMFLKYLLLALKLYALYMHST
jgi:hypothetical protein